MEESVSRTADIDESRTDAGLDIGHSALVDVAEARIHRRPLHVELLKAVFPEDGDATLLLLRRVDQNLFCHGRPFQLSITGILLSLPPLPLS